MAAKPGAGYVMTATLGKLGAGQAQAPGKLGALRQGRTGQAGTMAKFQPVGSATAFFTAGALARMGTGSWREWERQ